jgi:hypothetical protein
MWMRLRLPELLDERKTTAYAIAQKSDGRIDESTLYGLARKRGNVRYLDSELLESLFNVLYLTKLDELLEMGREKADAANPPRRRSEAVTTNG